MRIPPGRPKTTDGLIFMTSLKCFTGYSLVKKTCPGWTLVRKCIFQNLIRPIFFVFYDGRGPAECAERLNPPPLPYGKSWRVEPKAQVRNCKSQICRSLTPLKSPPSAPAHSARPPQKAHPADFSIFHFARHSPSEMQKNCQRWILIRTCIKNAISKIAFR